MADGSEYNDIIEQAGQANNVDPSLIRAVLKHESSFNPKARGDQTSQGQAQGIGQLMPRTAQALGVQDPDDPAQAIPGVAKLLSQNLDQYGDVADAVSAYHGGTNQKNWGPKTQTYRDAVMSDYSGGQGAPAPAGSNLLQLASGGDVPPPVPTNGGKKKPDDGAVNLLAIAAGGGSGGDGGAPGDGAPGGGDPDNPKVRGTNEGLTDPQTAIYRAVRESGDYDADAPLGDEKHPVFVTPQRGDLSGLAAGAYYVTPDGKVNRTPGGAEGPADESKHSLIAGLGRGVGDVVQSVGALVPGGKDNSVYQGLKYDQELYDANHKGDLLASVGRIGGQIAGSAPLMAGADVGAGALGVSKLLGPVGTFLAGKAGQEAIPAAAPVMAKGVQLGTKLLSKAAQGAVQGGEAATLTSSASDAPLADQIKTGALLGGALSPAAGAIASGGKFVGGLARDLTEPLYQGGREQIADRAIRGLAGDGPTAVDTTELVPGSRPTLAEATGNTGLGAAERALKGNPTQGIKFAAREAANNNARALAISALKGDSDSLDTLIQARSSAGDAARDAAFSKTTPVDASPVLKVIDDTLASPAGQRDAVSSALANIRTKLAPTVNGTPQVQSDPAQLYGIRQAITDMLDTNGPKTATDARHATSELMKVKGALDGVIEQGAPGYKNYLSEFADNSKPIDEQKFLQSLNLGPIDANGNIVGNVTLGRVNQAISKIAKMRAQQGVNPAKSLSPETMGELGKLQADLARQSSAEPIKSVGAHTFQNLATDNLMNRLSGPAALLALPHNPVTALAAGGARMIYGAQNPKILDTLADKLVDPNYGASAFNNVRTVVPPSAIKRLAGTTARAATATAAQAARPKIMGSRSQ